MNKEDILKKIAEVEEERKRFVELANNQLSSFAGKIEILEELLEKLDPKGKAKGNEKQS